MRIGHVLLVVVALLTGPLAGSAPAVWIDFSIQVNHNNTTGVTRFRGAILAHLDPSDPELPFEIARVSSLDGQYETTVVGDTGALKEAVFFNYDDLASSLGQPFTIFLDEGLETERTYTMSLNLGALQAGDLIPPMIGFPISQSTINTLTPTFAFTTPEAYAFRATLNTLPIPGSSKLLAEAMLPGGTASWSPGVTLEPETRHFFHLYTQNIRPLGMGFTVPVGPDGEEVEDFLSRGSVGLEAIATFFTPVPEPSTLWLLSTGGLLALSIRWLHSSRRRR